MKQGISASKMNFRAFYQPGKLKNIQAIKRLRDIVNNNKLFLFTLVIPTSIAILYFGFLESGRYISESSFIVKSVQQPTAIRDAPARDTLHAEEQATHGVHDFMLSRDALQQLNANLNLVEAFGNHDIDLVHRFAGLKWWDRSIEAFYQFYLRRVSVELGSSASIVTVKVSAFTATDAYQINKQLLTMGEIFINALGQRATQDTINSAKREVELAEKKYQDASLALLNYDTRTGKLNPHQTDAHERVVVSSTNTVPDKKTNVVERLRLEQKFADKRLLSALASLSAARNEVKKQHIYIERIIQPYQPDIAIEPHRIRSILEVFLMGLISWGIIALLIANVKEHFD